MSLLPIPLGQTNRTTIKIHPYSTPITDRYVPLDFTLRVSMSLAWVFRRMWLWRVHSGGCEAGEGRLVKQREGTGKRETVGEEIGEGVDKGGGGEIEVRQLE